MYASPTIRACLRVAFALLLAIAIVGAAGPTRADDGSGDEAAQQTAQELYQQLINGPVTTDTCTQAWEMSAAENGNQCNSVTVSTSSDNCSVTGAAVQRELHAYCKDRYVVHGLVETQPNYLRAMAPAN